MIGASPDYWLLLPEERVIVPSTLVFSIPVFSDFPALTEKCQVIKKNSLVRCLWVTKTTLAAYCAATKIHLYSPEFTKLFSETTELNPAKVHEVLV